MEWHVKDILDQNRVVTDSITPYEDDDMRAVLQSQNLALEDALTKNVLLGDENSELRMHLSFLPVEYRDFVEDLQATDHQMYRKQRSEPQIIVPETDHKLGYEISLEDAPMANKNVQFALRDAQYTTLGGETRAQLDRGYAIRAKLTTDKATLVYPKGPAPWQTPIPPTGKASDSEPSETSSEDNEA
jgi:hypothetical protein